MVTQTHRAHGGSPVAELRPRSLSRRADRLRSNLLERRIIGLPQEELLLTVVDAALDRTHQVSAPDLDTWTRLTALLEEHRSLSHTLPAAAAAANLISLAIFGEVEDHAALAALTDEFGHDRLARLQHRYGAALEDDVRLPLTTKAVRRMLSPGLRARLESHPPTAARGLAIDDACLRAAHALMSQGTDRRWGASPLDSVEEFVDVVARGTIAEWRHQIALVEAGPWSSYPITLVELARRTGSAHVASVVATLVDLTRDRMLLADARRQALTPLDIERLVALPPPSRRPGRAPGPPLRAAP